MGAVMGVRAQPYTAAYLMGAQHFLLPLYLLFSENLALTCLPREYKNNGICCPMCDKGSFLKEQCTIKSRSSVCVICADNTYMDQPNSDTKCLRCKDCDLGAGLIVKEKCTTASNTICECKAHHFCPNQDCDLCQEHTQCLPGQYVNKPGTGRTDTVCEKCPPGHYSNESNSVVCVPWRKCSSLGLVLYSGGTLTADSLCKDGRGHGWIAGAFVCTAIVAATIGFIQCSGRFKQETKQMVVVSEPDPEYPLSEEEKGIGEGGSENSNLERT